MIVSDIPEQDQVVRLLQESFSSIKIIDRRIKPSHAYRAVHVVIKCKGKLIEVQIRTELQQAWAEISEKWADEIDPAIKYGGGELKYKDILQKLSNIINGYEMLDQNKSRLIRRNSINDRLQGMVILKKGEIEALIKQVIAYKAQ